MPQLDPSSFPSQLFWLAVSFTLLYVLMSRLVVPKLRQVLEGRESRISSDLAQAEELRIKASEVKQLYEKSLAAARAKAQQLVADTTATMQLQAAEKQKEMDATLARKVADAEAAIRSAKAEAMNKLTPAAVELTTLIVEKLVHFKPGADKVSAVVKDLTKERNI